MNPEKYQFWNAEEEDTEFSSRGAASLLRCYSQSIFSDEVTQMDIRSIATGFLLGFVFAFIAFILFYNQGDPLQPSVLPEPVATEAFNRFSPE